ncbi:hypothetical protein FRB90_003666 [Tulasnella sp. 427]|nr:hypothetical protein FRB90_003666 [Tulasnella sp. 427]
MALERSQNMLLDVDCMSSQRQQSDRLPEFLIHQLPSFSRRVGYLNAQEMDLEDLVNKGASMTGLASLLVRNKGSPELQDAPWTKTLVSSAPKVRKLTLTDCSFDWPDPGWTNLESLHIEMGIRARSFNLGTLLTALSASPGLKDLELSGRQTTGVPAGPRSSEIHLPELETLSIQLDSTMDTFQLLDSIDASPTVSFWLNINQENLSPPRLRTLGRFADKMNLKGERLIVHRNQLDVGSFGIRIYDRGGTAGEAVVEGLRNFVEGLGESRLKDIEILNLDTAEFAVYPMMERLCPNVRCLDFGHTNSDILSFISSASPDSHPEWLFPRASSARAAVHDREDMSGIFRMIRARADAYEQGAIKEKIRRLELWARVDWIELGEAGRAALIAEAQHWKNEIRNMDPDLVAEFQAFSSNCEMVVVA